jgi:hypothetical protein
MEGLEQFRAWIERKAVRERYFSGTFWFIFSNLGDADFATALRLEKNHTTLVPLADAASTVSVRKRNGASLQATFWHIPIEKQALHILFSLNKIADAVRPMYKLLANSRGKAHLFPIGQPLARICARLEGGSSAQDTKILRGVSYPSRPHEGGAEIKLKPGNASDFFRKLEEEGRILKTSRMRAPVSQDEWCEFTVSRLGFISFHGGSFEPLFKMMNEKLIPKMSESVRPFERAGKRFVNFRFTEPFFTNRDSYSVVLSALSRLPRTSIAVLHANPYFHATLTNYEDGSEFDIFITGHSEIQVQGRGETSPASFLRVQNGLTELFRDAVVSLEKEPAKYSVQDLMEGRI